MASIDLHDACLDYRLYNPGEKSLRSMAAHSLLGGIVHDEKGKARTLRALDKVSLSLRDGMRLAVIGPNGAGKSTLLKLLAGVYYPSHGSCQTEGKIGGLFDIYHGMDDDMTGVEFILNHGLYRGGTLKQLKARMEEIRAFSGLGEYVNQPLRTYSSGMRVRLAFALATQFQPDILLLDEIFGAGDADFFDKATRRIVEISSKAGITVFSTHWLELAERFCNQAIWMEHGQIRMQGDLETVFNAYRKVRTHF